MNKTVKKIGNGLCVIGCFSLGSAKVYTYGDLPADTQEKVIKTILTIGPVSGVSGFIGDVIGYKKISQWPEKEILTEVSIYEE